MSAQRYLVTARKYRPQLFGELVAQEHVTETLKNAIRLDRLAHAYLFSGPRGVGKTTAARILAKAINCTTPLEERASKAEPCRRCESCQTFEQGRSLNIIEIDAASNNRVDDIRDLRETVRIPPQGGRKKVYIVDEVHMLSTAAFNALLKTLEEPPPHVLFIFATTEPHKVLPTILSRCQRFDFRRITVPEIIARLREICEEEKIRTDEASAMLIARKGDGALRDALSVFDQAVALCGTDITYSDLAQALGVVDVDLYFDVTDRIAARDTAGMLRLVERTVRSGHDLQEFLAGLAEHLRNLLVARSMDDLDLIEAAEATRQRYLGAARSFAESDLLRLLTLAAEAEDAIKSSTQPRLKVETVLLKMASIAFGADLREAIEKIDRLERMAREGRLPSGGDVSGESPDEDADSAGPARKASAPGGTSETPSAAGARATGGSSSAGSRQTSPPSAAAEPAPASPPSAGEKAPHGGSDAAATTNASGVRIGASGSASSRSGTGPSRTEAPVAEAEAPGRASSAADGVLGTPALRKRTTGQAAAVVDEEQGASDGDAGPITRVWNDLLERVKHDKIQVWSLLHHTEPEGFDDGAVRIAVPNDFHRRVLSSQAAYVRSHLEPLVDVSIRRLQFSVRAAMDGGDAEETASDFDPYEYMKRKRQENPVVRAIFEQFGGELVW